VQDNFVVISVTPEVYSLLKQHSSVTDVAMWHRCEETFPFYELDALNGSHARSSILK
jgi:hypothetical protein